MAFCKNCGRALQENAAFCENCGMGAGQGINYCANCGAALLPGVYTCPTCGAPVGNVAPVYEAQAGSSAPASGNNFAVTSLVLGLVGFCCCGFLFVPEILAIVFGILALKNHCSNRGIAVAGIVLGAITLVAVLVLTIVLPVLYETLDSTTELMSVSQWV